MPGGTVLISAGASNQCHKKGAKLFLRKVGYLNTDIKITHFSQKVGWAKSIKGFT